MTMLRDLPVALESAGVEVRLLDGWREPHDDYLWREPDGEPAGHMHHHTATSSYTPNRDKANGYAGLGTDESLRLYQSGGGRPIFAMANSYPAPISSGYGVRDTLESFVKEDIQFIGKQTRPDDTEPKWAGNTHYFNTEWVLDGVGTWIDEAVWDMMMTVNAVLCDLYDWSANRNIGHGQHTQRKIDLRGGQWADMSATMQALVWDTRIRMENNMVMSLERYATRWRNPLDFDKAAEKGVITEDEARYWKTVPTSSPEWQDLRDAIEVRDPLWTS